MAKPDCIVVGGGIIGMLTARELALAGLRVRLLERGQTGRESSWAGGGILSPLYPWRYPAGVTALAKWSQAQYLSLIEALQQQTGIDAQWTQNGMLMLAPADGEEALVWARQYGYGMEHLDASALHDIEPRLADSIGSALWMAEVAQVRNPRMMQALHRSLGMLGVEIIEHCEVKGISLAHGRVQGVDTSQGEMPCERAVIAGGAWTGQLLVEMGISLPVEPVRGQMLLFKTEPGLISRIILSGERYMIPRRDGRVLVGSTMEWVGFDKHTTEAAREQLYADAIATLPVLADYPIEHHWAGLRPGSPSGEPFIGELPRIAGLYVNAGHFRNGVVMGYASARLLADLMLQHPPIVDPAPYQPPGS